MQRLGRRLAATAIRYFGPAIAAAISYQEVEFYWASKYEIGVEMR